MAGRRWEPWEDAILMTADLSKIDTLERTREAITKRRVLILAIIQAALVGRPRRARFLARVASWADHWGKNRSVSESRYVLDTYAIRLAEREGFEPPEGRPSTVFKTAAFVRSATSPHREIKTVCCSVLTCKPSFHLLGISLLHAFQ